MVDSVLLERASRDAQLRHVAAQLLDGRDRVSIFAAMSPQLPVLLIAALLREARKRDIPVLLYTAEVGGSFEFLDAGSREDLGTDRLRIVMVAGGAPRGLAPRTDSLPLSLWEVDRLAGSALDCDIYAVRASATETGFDLGNMVGFTPAFLARTDVQVAIEISHAGEYVGGFVDLPSDRWRDPVIWHDTITPESTGATVAATPPDPVRDEIARLVASLIPGDATIQVGIGGVAEVLIDAVAGKSDIRVHSGMLPVALQPHLAAGRFGVAVSTGLSPFATRQPWPNVRLEPISETHAPATLAALHHLWAVNSAFSVDLAGQANAEFVGGVKTTAGGGQLDFMRAAHLNRGGASVLALAARTSRGQSRILPSLESPGIPTTAGSDVDYVVTEFGIAELTGRSASERARAIASVAHPDDRKALQ